MPNEGIRRSSRHAVRFGITAGLAACLIGGLTSVQGIGLITGMGIGVAGAMAGGLAIGLVVNTHTGIAAVLSHYAVRISLVRLGKAPWSYPSFLEEMTQRLLLRQSGSAYLFVHRLLRDHIADSRMRLTADVPDSAAKLQIQEAAAAGVDAYYAAHRPAPGGSDAVLVMTYDGKRRRDAPRGAARGHRQSGSGQPAQAGGPAVPGGKARPQADGRARLRLRLRPRTAHRGGYYRRPGKDPAQPKPPKAAPVAAGTRLTASATGDIPAVIAAAFAEANRRDPGHQPP